MTFSLLINIQVILHNTLTLYVASVEWNELGTFHEDYSIGTVSSPQTQTPLPNDAPDLPSTNPSSS